MSRLTKMALRAPGDSPAPRDGSHGTPGTISEARSHGTSSCGNHSRAAAKCRSSSLATTGSSSLKVDDGTSARLRHGRRRCGAAAPVRPTVPGGTPPPTGKLAVMATELPELLVLDHAEWHTWLDANHSDVPGVWLVAREERDSNAAHDRHLRPGPRGGRLLRLGRRPGRAAGPAHIPPTVHAQAVQERLVGEQRGARRAAHIPSPDEPSGPCSSRASQGGRHLASRPERRRATNIAKNARRPAIME